ncbi:MULTISPECIES: PAAR domain-containing protein [Cupriavidus]|uniref:PAAR domain-containing protein n=1 Tax=Cupriavidus oxalaticus TaxID=96344 RepID=A0A4P7LDW8_9BURK|nr:MULTISPECIES: PAAR domain-containing protein [Cupriavidus]MBF6991118.1 PAAR domain-containing protein [Cupriavidus sp. IK-TO18]QBY54306.1 PAAR domain-containing protein [Cupriavidus oxalaticus]
MPDIRYALLDGDKTNANGVLIATGESMFHHGVKVGVEGDYATCLACKAGGPVMNDCYPAFDLRGKQILVSGARVYCKCPTNPIVIHSQTNFTIEVNRMGHYAPPLSSGPSSSVVSASHDTQIIEQYYELVDAETGAGEEGYRYDLFVEGQRISQDTPFGSGATPTVRGGVSMEIVMWLDKAKETRA